MHPPELRAEVRRLVEEGLKDGEIARALGMARTTVRDIRSPRTIPRPLCWRCWRPTRPMWFDAGEYAELLGLYLGDGCIVRAGRTERLRISFDARHPLLIAESHALLARCFPGNRVKDVVVDDGSTVVLSLYSSHLSCLFPQHAPGKKHHRAILLEPWQRQLVALAPWSFIRGCVHSDGCLFINRTGPYRYLAAEFHNRSGDILDLVAETFDSVGLAYRRYTHSLRVYRRESMTEIACFVGAKR